MSTYTTIIGIDVSKNVLDINELTNSNNKSYSIKNTNLEIRIWLSKIKTKNTLFVLEPTGCYSQRVLYFLRNLSFDVSLVNPSQSHNFMQVLGITNKNDVQAAKALALMGQRLDLPLYNHRTDDMENRKQLLTTISGLKKQRQMLKNQLHAFNHQIVFATKAVESLKTILQTVEIEIQELEEQLNTLDDEEIEHQLELMQSVVGIGSKTAQALICATGGIQNFKQPQQLAKFLGLAPSSHISGSSVYKKGGITKKGNAEVRACLYMATRSARKYNKSCKDLYDRLRSIGKCHKVAAVAVMHKLVKQVFGVVKSGNPFDNQYYLKFNVN
ncbi:MULTISPECIES: IS110 family transposase [unclassified Aureispira]|uniref:IS110 family transposase n=1 Tax=unclassified Aureispira TaxID=2649989 RepID=UPI0006982DFE|nr:MULTISPECIES: IS110 family transposase [unclassified Aureispira]WMX13024.1 IS110 family transposase [Aureispira sp. CCB-E]